MRCVNGGCDWQGTVGTTEEHVTKCGFTLASCPHACGAQVLRKDMNGHVMGSCPNRDFRCKYCGEQGTYAKITEEHDHVCEKKQVPCPNKECALIMERREVKEHIQTACKFTEVPCRYHSIGCKVQTVRRRLKEHEEEDKSHLHLALEKIAELDDAVSSSQSEMASLKVHLLSSISSLRSTMFSLKKEVNDIQKKESVTFRISDYGVRKQKNGIFYSEPFFTHPGGYKMCTLVYCNGYGDKKGTHLSTFTKLMEGPNNAKLVWPFVGATTIELLNQLEDANHHSTTTLFRATHNVRAGRNLGDSHFLPHSKLSHDSASNTQYLMDGTLYFRVTVTVEDAKPWLVCTHPSK